MRDFLRQEGYLPSSEPYSEYSFYQHVGIGSGNESITNATVLETTGANAIVDWVFVELRNADDPTKIEATRSALLQRDGDVVDLDGISSLQFTHTVNGTYYVAIRHRNHLGVMSAAPMYLTEETTEVDFSDPSFATYGENSQVEFLGVMALQGGDLNQDGKIIHQGPENEPFYILSNVLSAEDNIDGNTNFVNYGYHLTDLNMDGMSIFTGPNSDRSILFIHVFGGCANNEPNQCVLQDNLPR